MCCAPLYLFAAVATALYLRAHPDWPYVVAMWGITAYAFARAGVEIVAG